MSTYCGALAAGMNAPTGTAVGRPRAFTARGFHHGAAWLRARRPLEVSRTHRLDVLAPSYSSSRHRGPTAPLLPASSLRSTPDIQPCLRDSTETRLGEDMLTLRGPKLAALISSGRRKTLYTSESQVCAEVLTFQLCVFTSPVGPYKGAR